MILVSEKNFRLKLNLYIFLASILLSIDIPVSELKRFSYSYWTTKSNSTTEICSLVC